MLKIIKLFSLCLALSGCALVPGMQNLDAYNIKAQCPSQIVHLNPTLIPITPLLLAKQPKNTYHYRIAPADVLSINVWQHPEFNFIEKSTEASNNIAGVHGAAGQPGYLVSSKGQINFPLVGYLQVAGKTTETIHASLVERLKKYVPNPQVNVRVADYRGQKAYVLGEVLRPRMVPFTDQPLTIADALALAGGIDSKTADPRYIYVIRGCFTEPLIYWLDAKTPDRMLLAEEFAMLPKDILYVSSMPIARWNRIVTQLMPTIQPLWYSQAIFNNI